MTKSSLKKFVVLFVFLFLTTLLFAHSLPARAEEADTNVYLVWRESDFKQDKNYLLTDDDEDNVFTYTFVVNAPRSLVYYIETLVDGKYERYYPTTDNVDGVVELEEAGAYEISFNKQLRTTRVQKTPRYYYFGEQNDFTQSASYALEDPKDGATEHTIKVDFDEVKSYSFYIRDVVEGRDYYTNDTHTTEIAETGLHIIQYSPTTQTVSIRKDEGAIYYLYSVDSDYKTNAQFELKQDKTVTDYDEFTYSFWNQTAREFHYYVFESTSETKFFPNQTGIVALEKETEYVVKFSPTHKYDEGETYQTTIEPLTEKEDDATYSLVASHNNYVPLPLVKNKTNTRFDEYTYALTLTEEVNLAYYILEQQPGEETENKYYANKTAILKLQAGEYVVYFSKTHAYNSFDGQDYFTTIQAVATDIEYYLFLAENDYEKDDGFRLTLDSENDKFDEYLLEYQTEKEDTLFAYYVQGVQKDGTLLPQKYRPNASGVLTLAQIDTYLVRFSLGHTYLEEDDKTYHTTVDPKVDDFGGFFLIGNFNNYRYQSGTAFAADYQLTEVNDTVQKGYDYYIELDVTGDMINELEVVRYFISDGETRYRGSNQQNFSITEPGLYSIHFASPDDDGVASVYHYAIKKYPSVDSVSRLLLVDENDNYVYIDGSNFTSDMEAKLVKRGRYLFVDIIQNGKSIAYDPLTITYFVGNNPEQYQVVYYSATELSHKETEHLDQFLKFELQEGVGFAIEEIDPGLSPMLISIIFAACALLVLVLVLSIVFGVRKSRKMKKAANQ